jgi:hypothetical protein
MIGGDSGTPPWQRRGGCDIKKMARKPPKLEQTGRFVQNTTQICLVFERTTPSARFRGCLRPIFLGLAATPPLPRRGVVFTSKFPFLPASHYSQIRKFI